MIRRGWDIDHRIQKDDKSESKFRLARKGRDTFVAVTGTESLADVKSDLNLHSIPYKEGDTGDLRKVHAGFSYYTTNLLDTPYEGTTLKQVLKADAASGNVTLTGHSLGGAAALLAQPASMMKACRRFRLSLSARRLWAIRLLTKRMNRSFTSIASSWPVIP